MKNTKVNTYEFRHTSDEGDTIMYRLDGHSDIYALTRAFLYFLLATSFARETVKSGFSNLLEEISRE